VAVLGAVEVDSFSELNSFTTALAVSTGFLDSVITGFAASTGFLASEVTSFTVSIGFLASEVTSFTVSFFTVEVSGTDRTAFVVFEKFLFC